MRDYEQTVFISYAWGGEQEEIVNQIDHSLQTRGIKIIRDKRELGYKDSIKALMTRIGQGNCVIVVISDKYLRSKNCMFELIKIAENEQFKDRIFPVVLSDADIYDSVKRIEYIKYWEEKKKELDTAIKTVGSENLKGILDDMDLYDTIRDEIAGLTDILQDMNTLTPDMHQDSNFSHLYETLKKRLDGNLPSSSTGNKALELAIARVYDQSNRVIGTAFLVDDTRILTCAHMIQESLGASEKFDLTSQQPTVKIDFPLLPQQKTCFARVTFIDHEKNLAGLELTSDPPPGTQPAHLVIPEGELWGHKFQTFGFSMPEGVWASGKLIGKNTEGWIQIKETNNIEYSIRSGFSGAPVWDEELQAVVGMMVTADNNANKEATFCIPCELFSIWDAVKNKIMPSQQKAHIFLSYKRDIQPDQQVMGLVVDGLTKQGYTVFTDATIRMGENWLERIDEELVKSDYLVVLLSDSSADSEMVQSEIHRAYEYRKKNGHPQVLPIRVAYEDILPYSISAFLNPLQYILWQNEKDNERVVGELIEAMQGQLAPKKPYENPRVISEEKLTKPVPEFDAGILDELQMPGGTVKLKDKFYIERDEDARLANEMKRLGSTVTIRAARQSGKSSLLVRGIQQAKKVGANTLLLDMQRVDKDHLTSLDVFLRYLAEYIVFKLSQDADVIDRLWKSSLSPQEKLTSLFEDHVLENVERNVVIGMDEIDQLLATPFYNEFFGLLRSWHNLRATDERWEKLSTIMVISTEPYLLISDSHQSPFNVGMNLYLQDFNVDQVRELNQRHGSPVAGPDFDELVLGFGGHPYLTRKALYLMVVEKISWKKLKESAAEEHGPFGDHLRRYHWMIEKDSELKNALRSVIENGKCPDMMLHRLLQAGLVKASGDVAKCRCDLYRIYFEDKL